LEKLEDKLLIQRFIDNDPVGSLVMQSLKREHKDHEFFCDDPDDPDYLFGVFGWQVTFDALSDAAADAFINEMPERGMMFSGTRHHWAEKIWAAREPKWKNQCHLIWWPHKECHLEVENIVRPLTIDDAELVNKFWEIGGGDSLDYVKERIEKGVHVGCDDAEGLVSWALTHEDGSMGFLHTMERGRRKGYARSVGIEHIKKILAAGQTPFAYILLGNDVSLNFSKTLGLEQAGYGDYFGYEGDPPESS